MEQPRTLADLLLSAANTTPSHGITFAENRESPRRISYPALLGQSACMLAGLRALGAKKGDNVVICLLMPSSFLPLYWACLLGGLVPAPTAPLVPPDDNSNLQRLVSICRLLDSPLVVCDDAARPYLVEHFSRIGIPGSIASVESLRSAGTCTDFTPGSHDDIAMIQFSSGSTSDPKGACLRHRNLIANCQQMAQRTSLSANDVEVGWMPLHHDMGLIGCHLTQTLVGAEQLKIPTFAFLKRPILWLQAATRAKATLLTGTNTALRLLLRQVSPSDLSEIDLSTVRNFLIGAETVFPAVLRATQDRLAAAGLPTGALRTAYGLAECCVGVGFDPPGIPFSTRTVSRNGLAKRLLCAPENDQDAYELSDVGRPYEGCELRVVDDLDSVLKTGEVGHVQVRGPQVMAGYYQNDTATASAFCGDWLRTGDLGYQIDGQFGICGRSKETLIVAGRNLFASDVENIAAESEGIRAAVIAPVEDTKLATESAALFLVLDKPDAPDATARIDAARRKVQRVARLPIGWVIPISSKEIPRTSSGKIRRLELVEQLRLGVFDDRLHSTNAALNQLTKHSSMQELEEQLLRIWSQVLQLPDSSFTIDDPFLDLGGSSVSAIEMLGMVEQLVGRSLGQEMLLACSSIAQMAEWIRTQSPMPSVQPLPLEPKPVSDSIAIVAMACRFPGADDPEAFRRNLMDERCEIKEIPADRMGPWARARLPFARGAFLRDPYAFDPSFFGIPEAEALVLDPQQRIILELVAQALEQAGLGAPWRNGLRIGSFLGVSTTPYRNALASPTRLEDTARSLQSLPSFQSLPSSQRTAILKEIEQLAQQTPIAPASLVGNMLNMVAARVAHTFDLSGPAIAVDTACSSSLVAVHLACNAIRSGECDVAIAGGIQLGIDPDIWHYLSAAGALSPTGNCLPFGQNANGMVPGEGAAVVVLRRRLDAEQSGSPIHALILGSAVGNDGRALSPTAPNPRGQRATLLAAYRNAAVDPKTIAAIEAHGTGTAIGDPIEVSVLNEVFAEAAESSILFGSVKSNIGHLLAAAGIAGLLKLVLALKHGTLPPTLYANPPNPSLKLSLSPLRLANLAHPLPSSAHCRVGVSAFGFGGTDAHVVLERSDLTRTPSEKLPVLALPLSAPSTKYLAAWAQLLAAAKLPVQDLAVELSRGKTLYPARAFSVLSNDGNAGELLAAMASGNDWACASSPKISAHCSAILMFPGQGAQSVHQARGLLSAWPEFRTEFLRLLAASGNSSIYDACYGNTATNEVLRRTDIAQPMLVAFQIALARTLMNTGIQVGALIGHSIGELSAAAIAGVLDPESAVRWAAQRGKLMQDRCAQGGMLAIAETPVRVAQLIFAHIDSLAIAGLNAPDQTIVAGLEPQLSALAQRLDSEKIAFLRVPVAHGFHSPAIHPIRDELAKLAEKINFRDHCIPIASTLLGRWLDPGEMTASYWGDHASLPVLFEQALSTAASRLPNGTQADWLLEIGPGATLTKLSRKILGRSDQRPIVSLCRSSSAPNESADLEHALGSIGSGWVIGSTVDWSRLQPAASGTDTPIPTIPFARKHLRIDSPPTQKGSRLLHRLVWEELPAAPSSQLTHQSWLVFSQKPSEADALAQALREQGCRVTTGTPATSFIRQGDHSFGFDPGNDSHWRWIKEAIEGKDHCLNGWIIVASPDSEATIRWIHSSALTFPSAPTSPAMWVVTCDGSMPSEDRATISTFAAAVVQERAEQGRSVELLGQLDQLGAQRVVEEIQHSGPSLVRLGATRSAPRVLRESCPDFNGPEFVQQKGVYLVFGGTGGIGSLIAKQIAALGGHVVLASRRSPSIPGQLEFLQNEGVQASFVATDVRNQESVSSTIRGVIRDHGKLNGIVFGSGVADGLPIVLAKTGDLLDTIRTKSLGVKHLAHALIGIPIDWVLLLSSVAAAHPVLGRGLAAYAAANAALDAVALSMRLKGAPWFSLAFSLWRGVGMGNRPGIQQAVEHANGRALDPEEALDAISLALRSTQAHWIVTDPEDRRVIPSNTINTTAPAAPKQTATAPKHLPIDPRPEESTERFLLRRIAEATGTAQESIDYRATFASLGLDSLVSVELARELEKRLGRTLSATILFENDTLERLLLALEASTALPSRSHCENSAAPPLPSHFPLLPSQATFLAQQEFHPEIPSYVFLRIDLKGQVSPKWLNESLNALSQRHGMLRVVFDWHDGKPVHRVFDHPPSPIEVVDFLQLPKDESELSRFEHEFRNRVFNLATDPAYRFALVQRTDDRATLLFSAHHILADAWSAHRLITELLQAHEAYRNGDFPEWSPIPSNFAQCVEAYQNPEKTSETDKAFWQEELRDAPTEIPLPFDGDPAALTLGHCGLIETVLDDSQTAALETLARHWEVSTFHVVFASYLSCLRRWTGCVDIPIRVAQARRDAPVPGIDAVFGSFADSLPLRLLTPGQDVQAIAQVVRTRMIDLQKHSNISSLAIANLHRHRSHSGPRGITPAGLSFPAFRTPERIGQLAIVNLQGGAVSGFTQLGLIVYRCASSLHFSWNFHESLFKPSTIERLSGDHLELLTSLLQNDPSPQQGRSRRISRTDHLLHHRVIAAAERSPSSVAVAGDRPTSYASIENRSGALAAAIIEENLGSGDLVAVLGSPTPESIIGILGVLRSGSGYLPIDPSYPSQRIAGILQHSGVRTIITTSEHLPQLSEATQSLDRVLLLDIPSEDTKNSKVVPWTAIQGLSHRAPKREARPDSLAYVMYTSGTTGHPKGVMVKHHALCSFHSWVESTFNITSHDRFIPTSTLAFGASLRQVFSPLIAGGTVVPASPALIRDPFALVGFLEDKRITIWNSVPTLWAQLLDAIDERDREGIQTKLNDLRWVLVGGEDLPAPLVRRWMDRFGTRHRIVNLFGCAETIVNSVVNEIRIRPTNNETTIPIGLARDGAVALVLDEKLEQCSEGQVGILHIGGEALAEGYLHEAKLTETAFISSQWGRIYRTGDLARRDNAGRITYLGRDDSRVKIRGNRVELSEIEGTLRNHQPVRDAACVSFEKDGRQWLCAFVILTPTAAHTWEADLRKSLQSLLPSYMLPHRYIPIDNFPLNSNGKVDRKSLIESLSVDKPNHPAEAALSPSESILIEIWKDVLGLATLDRSQDFFEAGGDSILAIDMFRRLRGRFPVLPRPVVLYAERTIAKLAALIDSLGAQSTSLITTATEHADPTGVFPLSPAQTGFLFVEKTQTNGSPIWFADIPINGPLDTARFSLALDGLSVRHPMLRTSFLREAGLWMQKVLPAFKIPLEVRDWHHDNAAIDALWSALRATRFDIETWPLFGVILAKSDSNSWHCLLAVHHIIGDAWSLRLFLQDLLACYEGNQPPALQSSYADVVTWYKIQTDDRRKCMAYWENFFRRPPSLAKLDLQKLDPRTETISTTLSSSLTSKLRSLARTHKTTLHLCILTIWFNCLRSAAAVSDLTIGTASSGRDIPVPDAESMVGCFANSIPVRATITGKSFEEDLHTVSTAWQDAYANGNVPVYEAWRAAGAPSTPSIPGLAFFFSFMEFKNLEAPSSASLYFDLASAKLHFAAESTNHEAMLTVLVDEEIRLQIRGLAVPQQLQSLLDDLHNQIQSLSSQVPGKIAAPSPRDDAAIIAYLPSIATTRGALGSSVDLLSLRKNLLSRVFPNQSPKWLESQQTALGRTGSIILPLFAEELASVSSADLSNLVAQAVGIARQRGARAVSLAGLLPSLTSYGHAVRKSLDSESAKSLTTGHAVTVAAVVSTLAKILGTLKRSWNDQNVAIVGFGSMGQGIAALMLFALGKPHKLVICDHERVLPSLSYAVQNLGCPVRLVGSNEAGLPNAVYDCDLVIGATNTGGVLDVRKLKNGAVLADDSFPPIYDKIQVIQETFKQGRVLVVGAGRLTVEATQIEREALDLPAAIESAAAAIVLEIGAIGMPGCRVEALLVANHGLDALTGLVSKEHAISAWNTLLRLGVDCAPLHLGSSTIPQGLIDAVRSSEP